MYAPMPRPLRPPAGGPPRIHANPRVAARWRAACQAVETGRRRKPALTSREWTRIVDRVWPNRTRPAGCLAPIQTERGGALGGPIIASDRSRVAALVCTICTRLVAAQRPVEGGRIRTYPVDWSPPAAPLWRGCHVCVRGRRLSPAHDTWGGILVQRPPSRRLRVLFFAVAAHASSSQPLPPPTTIARRSAAQRVPLSPRRCRRPPAAR